MAKTNLPQSAGRMNFRGLLEEESAGLEQKARQLAKGKEVSEKKVPAEDTKSTVSAKSEKAAVDEPVEKMKGKKVGTFTLDKYFEVDEKFPFDPTSTKTIRIDPEIISYLKMLSDRKGVAAQNLVHNILLRWCVEHNDEISRTIKANRLF